MKYDFKAIKLKDCCSFQEGYVNPSQSHPEYFGGSIKWIRAVDLNNANVYNTTRTLSEIGFRSAGKSALMFEPNTIVISKSGTIGRLGIIKDYMCGNRATINIKPKDNIDLTYLFYFLRSKQKEFEDLAVGSVQKNLYVSILEGIEISLPSLPLQRKIVSIVKDIDEKIELNNAINNNLFDQAQALFKNWFIDFAPFTDDGSMPKEWRIGTVGEIIELHDSKRVPLSGSERDKMEKIYPYYGATSLMDYVDDYLFDGIYLLLGEDGTVIDEKGYPILQYLDGKFWVNNHAHILTGKLGFSVEELYLLFSITNIKSIVTGAVQQKVSQGNLKSVPVIIPRVETLKDFDDIIQPIFAEIRNRRAENTSLAALRDTLLPKLMSGELDVSDIDL